MRQPCPGWWREAQGTECRHLVRLLCSLDRRGGVVHTGQCVARSTHRATPRLSRDIARVCLPDMKFGKIEPGNDYHTPVTAQAMMAGHLYELSSVCVDNVQRHLDDNTF